MLQTSNGARSIAVVIAALNEANTIEQVISGIKELKMVDTIIVVDDASSDETPTIAKKHGCTVLSNGSRIGQTRSLRKGIGGTDADIVVTMDADLEHAPTDIPLLLAAMEKERADVVIGRRAALPRGAEKIMSFVVSRTTGVTDTISGFRIISRKALQTVEFDNDDTWGSLFLIRCAGRGLKIVEQPITTPPPRPVTRTGGALRSNIRILRALLKDVLCMADFI